MKKICWVTSFSSTYYENIAKHTLKNWNMLLGDKILLAEMDTALIPFDYQKINITGLDRANKEFADYFFQFKKAYRFYKKACSIDYALRNFKTSYDYIIWLDSDVIIKKEFDPSAFLPNDDQLYSSIFKTDNLPDSGFIAFNTKHADYDKFLKDYLNYYFSKKIMSLGNPYDNYILSDYMTHTSVRNLWKGIVTDKSDATCGFVDTVLEDVLDHHWGKKGKKEIGL
jgi:hypothetical protein